MSYTPNIPLGSQSVASTQQPINNNFTIANTAFGIDHQAFTVNGATQGFHKKVTMGSNGSHPLTPLATPVIYANQDNASIGVINYSMPGGNTGAPALVPTPLTSLQSPTAAIAMGNGTQSLVFDFVGIPNIITAVLYAENQVNSALFRTAVSIINWDGAALHARNISQTNVDFSFFVNGTQLELNNLTGSNLVNVYWTLQWIRIT